ncbi:Hypothetical predicted protein [Mytilus galloprovincialis]|uniref:Uncharacterized protein n=1 Tax=Mytilus galloprovincialis TaxID=29158 RepID=A0A8B6HHB5_MYTGA|nr:Hypothetical predicted protein [Mytilus galloprovincialis]
MSVRRQLALEYISFDIDTAEQLLIEAAHDGYQCFCSKGTSKSICEAVDICQYLAKFPEIRSNGSEYVTLHRKSYLFDALDYLNYGIQQSGPTNYYLVYKMGAVLYDLDELKPAIDWMKRALSLSHNENILLGDTIRFSCMLNSSKVSLLTECTQTCIDLMPYNNESVLSLEQYLEQLRQIPLVDDIEPKFDDEFKSTFSMPTVLITSHLSNEFLYDFFVSYSHKDSD